MTAANVETHVAIGVDASAAAARKACTQAFPAGLCTVSIPFVGLVEGDL